MGEVERAQLRVDLAEVRDRRHDAGLERLHRDDVFQPDAHRMTGDALRIRDHDAVGVAAEHVTQRVDLGSCAAAPRGGVGLVRDEDHLGGHGGAVCAASFALAHHRLHHAADVLDIQPGAVEGAVRGDRAQHLADRLHAALAR